MDLDRSQPICSKCKLSSSSMNLNILERECGWKAKKHKYRSGRAHWRVSKVLFGTMHLCVVLDIFWWPATYQIEEVKWKKLKIICQKVDTYVWVTNSFLIFHFYPLKCMGIAAICQCNQNYFCILQLECATPLHFWWCQNKILSTINEDFTKKQWNHVASKYWHY